MDSSHRPWPPQSGAAPGNAHISSAEQSQSQAARPGANYGQATPQQHAAHSSPLAGPALPPPSSAPFPPFHQPSHALAGLTGLSQSSPRQPPVPTRQDGPPSQHPSTLGYSLPGIGQATGQASASDRERERAREEQIHIKEEQDRHHREEERRRQESGPPHQILQGPTTHLHQPVAVGPRSIHGPNGLLGNPGPQPAPQMHFGAPSGPGNIFSGGPVQPTIQSLGSAGQQLQPALNVSYPSGQAQSFQQQQQQQVNQSQGQGQQPILNDALSYLDQVKVQFADHPDVYNRFLDIMKDFKSGAIDTPGVIGRVSTLFAGSPDLIQGFNTFLPPGYRIECGAGDDPNAIRVTTPMGTTVQSMPQARPLSRQEGPDGLRPTNGAFTPQPGQGPQMLLSPSGRTVAPVAPGQGAHHITSLEAARHQEQHAIIHQQEQRGVNQLQSAVSAASGARAGMSPAPGRATPVPAQDPTGLPIDVPGQLGGEKRGPVEFNHAISYVNKIKNRFASHPDIYKQFLEILQTYQRESKPIQDVYTQVTHLFKTAPDLLEDFKQFLPESAAQAKAAAQARQAAEENAMLSHVREGPNTYSSPVVPRDANMGTPNHGRGLPPVGNFAPTPISKDNKRKRGERQGTVGINDALTGPSVVKAAHFGAQPGKRIKQTHTVSKPPDQPPASPTLVPALPSPIPPTSTAAATSEEITFFDRAKKAIGNKNTMNEFLKLCNLFSQDLIDRTTLVFRARAFIGGNPDLMKWFQDFIGYDERDVVVENKARIPGGRISLSNCRGLGPSYRLLPKRERQRPCSGRDELCNSVLNDDWASHPTWASEDSGFIAHRKNTYEEALHRIEEERHDYDFNIETCSRTIQLLDPIAHQLHRMSDAEQRQFRLPPGLGGQSETIYKRVIMKLYGRERGREVVDRLHETPYQVIPVLLNRLKERLETWRMAQREWEKVWRDQTQKMFWRSLDHQAITVRTNDKRQFQMKTLQNEIQVKYEEMKRSNLSVPGALRKPQMEFTVENLDVLIDATHLILIYVDMNLSTEQPRLASFIREFIPLFFGMDSEWFNAQIRAKLGESPSNEASDEPLSGAEDSSSRGRKPGAKYNSLLRSTLDKGTKKSGRREREGSQASASRATTPEAMSLADEENAVDTAADLEQRSELTTTRWLEHPGGLIENGQVKYPDPNEPKTRSVYRFWANTPMYCFLRVLTYLYDRLLTLKENEAGAREAVRNAMRAKPAIELGIVDKVPSDFFADTSSRANYYAQMLQKFEDVLKGDVDMPDVEEALRRFYLGNGYQLYGFEKMVAAISKYANNVLTSESKDRSWDIYQLFKKDRSKQVTTATQQTDYRKTVEKLIKESEIYRIVYDQGTRRVGIYLTKKEDPFREDGLSPSDQIDRWRYYLASFGSIEMTDGVPVKEIQPPFLPRNVRAIGADPTSNTYPPSPSNSEDPVNSDRLMRRFLNQKGEEMLEIRIRVEDYRMEFEKNTSEGWFEGMLEREGGEQGVLDAEEKVEFDEEQVKEKYVMNNPAMRDVSKEAVEKENEAFKKLTEDGIADSTKTGRIGGAAGDGMDLDA